MNEITTVDTLIGEALARAADQAVDQVRVLLVRVMRGQGVVAGAGHQELQFQPDPVRGPVLEEGPWDPGLGGRFGQGRFDRQVAERRRRRRGGDGSHRRPPAVVRARVEPGSVR